MIPRGSVENNIPSLNWRADGPSEVAWRQLRFGWFPSCVGRRATNKLRPEGFISVRSLTCAVSDTDFRGLAAFFSRVGIRWRPNAAHGENVAGFCENLAISDPPADRGERGRDFGHNRTGARANASWVETDNCTRGRGRGRGPEVSDSDDAADPGARR